MIFSVVSKLLVLSHQLGGEVKVTVFSAKGGVGKTPISVNIALDKEWAIGTNETYHIFDSLRVIPDNRILAVEPREEFPDLPADIDIVFDLSGTLGGDTAASIRSAVAQSDVVLVPAQNELKAINGAYHTIMEISDINPNVAVVVTKILKGKKEAFSDWRDSEDYKNVHGTLEKLTERELPAFPLKFSRGFDAIFEQEMSLNQMVGQGGLDGYAYKSVAKQFDDIYQYLEQLENQHGQQKRLVSV